MADELPALEVGDHVLYWPSAYDENRPGVGPIAQDERPVRATVTWVSDDGMSSAHLRVHLDGREFDMTSACPVLKSFPGGADAHRAAGTCFERIEE